MNGFSQLSKASRIACGSIFMTETTGQDGENTPATMSTETCSLVLKNSSLILDVHVMVN